MSSPIIGFRGGPTVPTVSWELSGLHNRSIDRNRRSKIAIQRYVPCEKLLISPAHSVLTVQPETFRIEDWLPHLSVHNIMSAVEIMKHRILCIEIW